MYLHSHTHVNRFLEKLIFFIKEEKITKHLRGHKLLFYSLIFSLTTSISCGNELFMKWPLSENLRRSEFRPFATACCSSHGIKGSSVDPNCTTKSVLALMDVQSQGLL